jgi:hypothetical protein
VLVSCACTSLACNRRPQAAADWSVARRSGPDPPRPPPPCGTPFAAVATSHFFLPRAPSSAQIAQRITLLAPPLLLVRSRPPRAPRRCEIEAEFHCRLHLTNEHHPRLFLPPTPRQSRAAGAPCGCHRPPEATRRRRMSSPPPSPSCRPRGESPIPPPCRTPPRLDLVIGRAPSGHRQAHHCARTTCADCTTHAPGMRTPAPRPWAGPGRAEPASPWAEWSAQHCAPVSSFLFSFKYSRSCCKLLKCLGDEIQPPKNAK